MTEEQMPNEIPAFIKPWINLIHNVGMPWVIIVLSAYYGIPFANDALNAQKAVINRLESLETKADKAMPLLDKATEAIPLLESIHRQQSAQAGHVGLGGK